MKKVCIIGSAGFVGKNLFKALSDNYSVFGMDIKESETTTHTIERIDSSTKSFLNSINPDILIDCKKLPKSVDYYELNRDEAINTDLIGTIVLKDWADAKKKKMIYVSSDYVYPGETNDYDEKSEVNPVNFYGQLRVKSESIVSDLANHVILRPTVIFGYDPGGMNFLMQMFKDFMLQQDPKQLVDMISHYKLQISLIFPKVLWKEF
jgi:dTDP-4-dehydrorhamnose reductase